MNNLNYHHRYLFLFRMDIIMKKISTLGYVGLFLVNLFLRLILPFIGIFLIAIFAKKTDKKATHHGQVDVQRYELPKWLFFMETPDEMLPGGLYEPTVLKIYEKYGWLITSYYWLCIRNVGHGFRWMFGVEVPSKSTPVELETIDLKYIFLLKGWQIYSDRYNKKTKSGFIAVPKLTIRTKKTM